MLDQLKSKKYRHEFQVTFNHFRFIANMLLLRYAPKSFLDRRNVANTKLSDATILTLILLQVYLGITSQAKFYRLVKVLLPHLELINLSRFNRRSRQLLPVIQRIRLALAKRAECSDVAIIDSFPLRLCQNIRNRRVKIFTPYANIGFNATKRIWFYGFKVHVVMDLDGLILNYVVTKASVHDAKEAPELIQNCPCPYILADVGYVGRKLVRYFRQLGYYLWTPYRSNMKGAKVHNSRHLKKLRRRIESCFSSLDQYKVEENITRSLTGFQARLELIFLIHN